MTSAFAASCIIQPLAMNPYEIFSRRGLRLALVTLAIAYALLAGLHTVADFDAGWHLATGRYLLQQHTVPGTDVLSYTSPGAPWRYPPFAGALLYLIFSMWGYAGLSWFCAICCAALVAFLVLRTPSLGLAGPLLAMLAVPAIAYRTTPRADLFTSLLFAVFLVELWRLHLGLVARLWMLPAGMLLWVNVHPGFVAGVGLLAAYLAIEALDTCFPKRRPAALAHLKRAWPWLVATVLASLVNPWGAKIYAMAAGLAGVAGPANAAEPARFVGELSSVRLTLRTLREAFDLRNPDSSFWWLLAFAIVAALLAVYWRRLGTFLLIAGAITASMHRLRYQGLFVILIVVVGSTIAEEAWERISERSSEVSLARGVTLAAAIAVCLLSCIRIVDLVSNRTYAVSGSPSVFGAGESWWYPERAAAFIEQHRLPGNIFQTYDVGGFTALRLGPEYPDYIDGRAVSPAIALEERQLLSEAPGGPKWSEVADRRNINTLLFSLAPFELGGIDLQGFCQSREWRPVYMDEVSVVFLRSVPRNRQWIDAFEVNCATIKFRTPVNATRTQLFQFYANSGAVYFVLSRDTEAEDALRRAIALVPNNPDTHLFLAQLYQQHRQFPEAEQEYEAALARKQSAVAWYALGRMYAAQHRYAEAEPAIATSAELSPTPANNYKALGQVQLKLQQPERALRSLEEAEKASLSLHAGEQSNPEFYAQLADSRAEAHRQLGHTQQAVELQEKATRLTPSVASRWSKLADLAQVAGDQQLAADALRHVQELQTPEQAAGGKK